MIIVLPTYSIEKFSGSLWQFNCKSTNRGNKMNYLFVILISTFLTGFLSYKSVEKYERKTGKLIFLILSVINLLISVVIVINKDNEEKKAYNNNLIFIGELKDQNSQISRKQDTIREQLHKLGLDVNFRTGRVDISHQTGYDKLSKGVRQDKIKETIKFSETAPGPTQVEALDKKDKKVDPANERSQTQNVLMTAMEDDACINKTKNLQYSKVCFDNKTGFDLVLVKYYGYWGSAVTEEVQALPAGQCTKTGQLVIDYINASAEKDFSFYFSKQDGTPCKYPYRITLKKCVLYTITLNKKDLGL